MVHRGAIFAGLLWLAATIPWLLTRALSPQDWVMYSVMFGSVNTVGVLGVLLVWTLLRKKLTIPLTFPRSLGHLYVEFLGVRRV